MNTPSLRSVELFGGAGGLALGTHAAGFWPEVFVEWDKWACDTVRENQSDGFPSVQGWRVHQGDVRQMTWEDLAPGLDLVSGGPPCQPFSMGGRARAANDERDMFPSAAQAIRTLKPKAFLLENVKGLTRSTFSNYFEFIKLRLEYPAIDSRAGETWLDHLHRLQAHHTSGRRYRGLRYSVTSTLVNAADYGVPQHRHRVFIIGFRTDISAGWSFPEPTHSREALLKAQWVDGDYWDEHRVRAKDRPVMDARMKRTVEKIRAGDIVASGLRWRTVRDALKDMPQPAVNGTPGWHNHKFQDGARIYPGHTGSPVDQPSKALKAGGHGVPGGENMLRNVDGSVRYFSVREAARIQTFPDEYELHGSWGEAMRQLGNAVPVALARAVAGSVADHLRGIEDVPGLISMNRSA